MKFLASTAGLLVRMLGLALLMSLPIPMWAALGDTAASVLTDQAQWKGTLSSVDNRTYVLHEITMPSGAKVREFVSPVGLVFGVAWQGQFPPNFQQLLGPYYQQVQDAIAQQKTAEQAEQQPRRRRGPVLIETPGIVFSQGGHLRSFHGQAYIPQLVPQGVQASDIR
ncbi:MAG: DUF2844 domain-containing protein [Candidatus Korobacteraceae bacterium]